MTAATGRRFGLVDLLDRAALAGSFLCMLHCLALPLAIAALPTLSAVLSLPESFHLWVLVVAAPMAAVALLAGRARHRAVGPLVVGTIGLALLATGTLLPEGRSETLVAVAGSIALAAAHVGNWRLRHRCRDEAIGRR